MTRPVRRGFPYYGVDLGIVLVDSGIPRPVGDVRHARTWPFPVGFRVADGARPADMSGPWTRGSIDAFHAAGESLARDGVKALITSCGLNSRYQPDLAATSSVPYATSALLQVPLVLRLLRPEQRVLLLTIKAQVFTDVHFSGAGITAAERARVDLVGLDDKEYFQGAISGSVNPYEPDRAAGEILDRLRESLPEGHAVGAIVLECTNTAPFAATIRAETGLPVWDVVTLGTWLAAGFCEAADQG